MTVLRWTDQAVDDLRSIRLFIERDSPRFGRLVAERLYEATSQIEFVYRVEDEAAILLTIYRSSRLFPAQLLDE